MNDIPDIDITVDLGSGPGDAAFADAVPQNGGTNSNLVVPPGAQPQHGNAQQQNQQPAVQQPAGTEPSLRDQLSGAFKAADGTQTDQANAGTVPPTNVPQLSKGADGTYRNADGTFATQATIDAFEAAQAAAAQPAQQQQQVQAPTFSARMTPVELQQFQSLPAELQQFVGRTMEDVDNRSTRYSEYDQLEQHIIGPRRAAFAQQGMNPVVAVNQLFALSDFAAQYPVDFILNFAQQRGIDLDDVLDQQVAAGTADPMVQQLQGQVNQLQGFLNQQTQQQQQAMHQQNLNDVNVFSTATGQDGKLLRPHLTDVMHEWSAQIGAIRAANPQMPNPQVLEQAYQNACWLNPAVRAKMQEASTAAERAAEQQRVAAAKAAGASVTGSPAGGDNNLPNNDNLSLRETLERQFAEARAV